MAAILQPHKQIPKDHLHCSNFKTNTHEYYLGLEATFLNYFGTRHLEGLLEGLKHVNSSMEQYVFRKGCIRLMPK